MLLGHTSSTYVPTRSAPTSETIQCIKYKTGYLRFPNEGNTIPDGVQQFYILPAQRREFKTVDYPHLFVLGLKDTDRKEPLLGILELNPGEYYNSHTITTRYMEQQNGGEFVIIMSGALMYDGSRVTFSDESGHFYMHFVRELKKRYGEEGYVNYITRELQPIMQQCFGEIPVVFQKYTGGQGMLFNNGEAPDADIPEHVQRFRQRVCKVKARTYHVHPDEVSCRENNFPGPDFCDDDVELLPKIQVARKAKEASSRKILEDPLVASIYSKYELKQHITDDEIRILSSKAGRTVTYIIPSARNTYIRVALNTLGLLP